MSREEIETIVQVSPEVREIHPRTGRPLSGNELTRKWSKNRKIAGAKYLREQERMTYREIGEWLGLSDSTAKRYVSVYQLPEEKAIQFKDEFGSVLALMQLDGLGKVTKRINELVPKERKISEVVKAGEFYKGSKGSNIQVNIANIIDKEKRDYNFDQ